MRLRREALHIERELAALDPANVEWQRTVAVTFKEIAALEASRGETAAAAALLEQAWTNIRAAMRQAPEHAVVAGSAGSIAGDYGRLLAIRQNRRGIEILQESIRILERYPDDRSARWQLCRSLLFLGEARLGGNAAATQAWTRAEQALASSDLANSPLELAIWSRLLIRRGRYAEAGQALTRLERTGYDTTELERLCDHPQCQTRQITAGLQKERK